jgi:transglutaminase/protease-like cytokinesis protein 3
LDDKEKVYLIYKWVANNIQYDYANYIAHNDVSSEPADVLSSKKGVCSGYSRLFTKLLTCLNFPEENIKNIIGHSKGLGFNYEDTISDENTDHEWNAVKINNKWCLIDTTWGAGSVIEGAYVPSYDEYYLCTPPAQFVRSHLPKKVEENLQFLDKPIDINTFQNMAYRTKYFFEYGFNGLSNDKMVQNICGDGKMTLKYNNNIRPILLVKVKKDGTEYNDWIMEKKITNGYDIIVYINEEGNYDVDISANRSKY